MEKVDMFSRLTTSSSNEIHAARREPQQKPDALYVIIEDSWPEAAKIEIFGRAWNIHAAWTTLGSFQWMVLEISHENEGQWHLLVVQWLSLKF